MLHKSDQPSLVDRVKEASDVGIQDEIYFAARDSHHQRVERIVLTPSRPKTVAEPEEVFLINTVQHRQRCLLDNLIFQCSDRQRALLPVSLGYHYPPRRLRPVCSPMDPLM